MSQSVVTIYWMDGVEKSVSVSNYVRADNGIHLHLSDPLSYPPKNENLFIPYTNVRMVRVSE